MTGFCDLEPLGYFGPDLAKVLVAVGWLDREMPFERGPSEVLVYRRLEELLKDPFQPIALAGGHPCNLCQFDAEACCGTNLFIPGDGYLFVCPGLITHYINAHQYAPPPAFGRAVLACPDTRSMEYKRLYLRNGGRLLARHA
ncbi:hypothetical protein WME79_42690 [Sorangium sp. So ce726]|uniref:DUF7919 family protein n=1 Tax=Sorangium sp. So ce726 TaxID=3133319 RepID=UPI003F638376